MLHDGSTQPAQKVAVLVPVYKSELSLYEQCSWHRCLQVLNDHPMLLVSPIGLDADNYLVPGYQIGIERFDARFFRNVAGYSRLLLSASFYERFRNYEYILIYQLDSFVFADQLLKWCARGYDYVGAPWLAGQALRPISVKHWRRIVCYVGNGGFSLRNVSSCIRLLRATYPASRLWMWAEDNFFSVHGKLRSFFRIPDVGVALQFAFETEPEKCFALNRQELPFGCHAWEKWNIGFWRPIFRKLGYEI